MNNYKQLISDDGSIKFLDYSLNFIDDNKNNVDIFKVTKSNLYKND